MTKLGRLLLKCSNTTKRSNSYTTASLRAIAVSCTYSYFGMYTDFSKDHNQLGYDPQYCHNLSRQLDSKKNNL